MSQGTDYEFEWDDAKAESNLAKHGVDFMDAMNVLLDPLAMTFYDNENSDDEERWVSLGCTTNGRLLLVVHTFSAAGPNAALVRVISARAATRREREQYERG
ncbi:MAG: BrnT family toxin [Betaproteobacteria bacterium]|nr:BrnT family toxin [Betaproteobacteria bacterium]